MPPKITEKTRGRLGKKIQRLRKSAGLSQEEFAERLRISRAHAGHVEQGIKSPSLELMERISRLLKIKISDLFS